MRMETDSKTASINLYLSEKPAIKKKNFLAQKPK